MPLSVKDGMGAWIKDFQKSDAPQFKGKSEKERREMAIAAYLDAKRGPQKEEVKPPFTPDPPGKKKPTKNSDGTTTGPMSRARQLAKMARDRAMKKEDVELDEAKYSWNDVNDALKKANYMRGNPAHIDRVASKFKYKSGNDKNFTHQDVKKNLSAAGIDGARHHDIMKHMKESIELDEAMTTAIELPNYFDLSRAEQDKITKMVKKYNVETPIEKRGRKNIIVADGPKGEMKKLERDLKRAGIKFVATESVEYIEEAITANTKYGRAHDNAMKLTDKAKKSRKIDHYVDAIKAHKEALKHAQSSTNKAAHSGHIRDLSKKLTMAEDIEQIDEVGRMSPKLDKASYTAPAKELKAYAQKSGGMDKKDFMQVADMLEKLDRINILQAGQLLGQLNAKLKNMDTSPREKVLSVLHKHGHNVGNVMPGTKMRRESVDEAFYGTQAQRIMSPLQKARQDKEKRDRDRDGKLKSTALPMRKKNEETVEAKSFDQKFKDHLKFATSKSKAVQDYMAKRKAKRDAAHAKQDPAAVKKNYGPAVIPPGTAYNKARKRMDPSAAANAVSNTFKNRAKGRKLPEEKIDEAVQFKVDVEGLPPTFMQGKSSAEILGKLRKIVKQPSMIKNVERYTDMEVKKAYRQKAQGRPVDEAKYADPEDNMPPSEDEGKMAIKQAKFIQYVGKELEQYVKNNKEFPEWMQNKISAFHQKSKDVHSILGGDYGDDEQNESTQAYGDTMRKQQRDRQQKMMKSGEMDKLQKMRAMLDKEKKK